MVRRVRGAGFSVTAAMSVLVLLIAGTAFGEEWDGADRERHIGTFEINGPAKPAGDRLDAPATQAPRAGAERELVPTRNGEIPAGANTATALFDSAEAALDDGETEKAQRLLEQLVAGDPDGPLAAPARRLLADLYRGVKPSIAADPAPHTAARDTTFPQRPDPTGIAPSMEKPPPVAAAPQAPSVTPPAAGTIVPPGTATKPLQAKPVIPKMLSQDKNDRYDAPRNPELEKKFRVEAGDRIFFAASSADLGARARTALASQARWLVARPDVEVLIEGHADEPGSDQDNKILSQQRAEAVRARLIEEGVAGERIAVKALGRKERVATCPDAECAVQNRRAVTVVFPLLSRPRLPPKASAQTTSVFRAEPMAVSGVEAAGGGAMPPYRALSAVALTGSGEASS